MILFGYIGNGEMAHVFEDANEKALCGKGPGIDMFEHIPQTWPLCQHCKRAAIKLPARPVLMEQKGMEL